MRMYESDKWYNVFPWFYLFMVIGGGVVFILLGLTLAKQSHREELAEAEAKKLGCEVIGHARDLGRVYFLKCDDQIKMVYIDD